MQNILCFELPTPGPLPNRGGELETVVHNILCLDPPNLPNEAVRSLKTRGAWPSHLQRIRRPGPMRSETPADGGRDARGPGPRAQGNVRRVSCVGD